MVKTNNGAEFVKNLYWLTSLTVYGSRKTTHTKMQNIVTVRLLAIVNFFFVKSPFFDVL